VDGLLQILRLVAERRELLLAPDRDVLDLVRHDRELHSTVPSRARCGRGLGSHQRSAGLEPRSITVGRAATLRPQRDEARADRALVQIAPASRGPFERRVLARAERPRVSAVALERDEAALAREHVRFVRLDIPQRPQAHRVHTDDAEVAEPREERRRPLGERTERGASARVGVLCLRLHPPDLVHDRREHQLDRLDRVEPAT
jgi:hypothetical protein